MQDRYGDLNKRLWFHDVFGYNYKDSNWWRDILLLCANPVGLLKKITLKLGDGGSVPFWKSRWLGNSLLAEQFPALFYEISNKLDNVSSMGSWNNDVWSWNIIQREEVLGLEASRECRELEEVLVGIRPYHNSIDSVIWPFDNSRLFTVKSCYNLMMQVQGEADNDASQKSALKIIWGSRCPSKLKIFGWRIVLNGLPTRDQLLRRGIITQQQDAKCVFCNQFDEDINHIMMHCSKLKLLWMKITGWLDIQVPVVDNCSSLLSKSVEELGRSMPNKRAGAVWLTAWWCIWNQRNNIVFNNAAVDTDEIFFKTMWFSWWWLAIGSKDRILCNFYEWFKNPSLCM